MCSRGGSRAVGRRGRTLHFCLFLRCAITVPLPPCPAAPLCALAAVVSLLPTTASAQSDLEESRRRLDEIRAERDRLAQQHRRLEGQVHDVNDELTNLERQRESTQ